MQDNKEEMQQEQEYLTQTPSIQWFPGHMAKTRRVMKESLGLVDIVVELRDARIPKSSRNPEIEKIIGDKPRLVVFNKADIADPAVTKQWQEYYKSHGVRTLALDCRSGRGLKELVPAVREVLADLLGELLIGDTTPLYRRLYDEGLVNSGFSSDVFSGEGYFCILFSGETQDLFGKFQTCAGPSAAYSMVDTVVVVVDEEFHHPGKLSGRSGNGAVIVP